MTSTPVDPYRERYTAPLAWWLGALIFGLTCAWLLFVASNAFIAVPVGGGATVVAAFLVWAYGNLTIEVDEELFRVGKASIPRTEIGEIRVVSGEDWHFLMGRGADHRALYIARPWLKSGVQVEIADPDDPAPFWLIGSRHSKALAAALGHTGTVELQADAP